MLPVALRGANARKGLGLIFDGVARDGGASSGVSRGECTKRAGVDSGGVARDGDASSGVSRGECTKRVGIRFRRRSGGRRGTSWGVS